MIIWEGVEAVLIRRLCASAPDLLLLLFLGAIKWDRLGLGGKDKILVNITEKKQGIADQDQDQDLLASSNVKMLCV